MTSPELTQWIQRISGQTDLYFYDAIAPIVGLRNCGTWDKAFLANRYDKGEEAAYLNCPMNKEEYDAFIDALLEGEKVQPKNFEKENFFQGCQPIEAIAENGRESLRFGPMKTRLDSIIRKRAKNFMQWFNYELKKPIQKQLTTWWDFKLSSNMVLRKKIFRMIPALKKCRVFTEWDRFIENTYLRGPKILGPDLSMKI